MEALALLCTLHADGPATLRRLHRAGCHSLDRLEAYAPEELAQILELPASVARRLGREARSLAERLDVGGSGAGVERELVAFGLGDREEAPEIASPERTAEVPGPLPSGSPLDRRDRAVLASVLERWQGDAGERERPAAREAARPRLRAGVIDGLDEELALRLAGQGIVDLAGLAAADGTRLAGALGLAYARVRRLQFLAGRAAPAGGSPAAPVAPRPEPRAESTLPPRATPRAAPGTTVPRGATDVNTVPPSVTHVTTVTPSVTDVTTVTPSVTDVTMVPPHHPEPPVQAPLVDPPRRKFWEPRLAARRAEAGAASVPPAPAATPAAPAAGRVAPPPTGVERPPIPRASTSPAPLAGERSDSAAGRPRPGATLNWNFELYPAAGGAAVPPPRSGRDAERDLALGEEGSAGPFA